MYNAAITLKLVNFTNKNGIYIAFNDQEGMVLHQVEVRIVNDGTAQTNITC